MSKKLTKRKRSRNWMLSWWRAVGEFKNNERKMIESEMFRQATFPSVNAARKAKARYAHPVYQRFIRKKGERRKRITEIQVFDEGYSGE